MWPGSGYLVHGRDGQPAMLPLCYIQHGNGGSCLVTVRVVTDDGLNPLRYQKWCQIRKQKSLLDSSI